jgi:hypothetical protein
MFSAEVVLVQFYRTWDPRKRGLLGCFSIKSTSLKSRNYFDDFSS